MEFKLEKWQTQYVDDFMQATDDPHLSDNLCETLPYPMDIAFAYEYVKDRMFNSEERQKCRAIIIDGHVAGGVDIVFGEGVFYKTADLSIWLAKPYRGHGLGAEVISRMCRETFYEYDIARIEAHPYTSHTAASSALKKAGFVHEGTIHKAICKNNTFFDYDVFALLKNI